MYDFEDKGGRRIALRPEGTAPASCGRSRSTSPAVPWKVWYVAPHFRYERPQKGRYRQHWQVGRRGARRRRPRARRRGHRARPRLLPGARAARRHPELNSMGDDADRAAYVEVLREYLLAHAGALGDDLPRAGRGQPAAGARLEGPRLAGRRSSTRRRSPTLPRRRGARRTSRRCSTGSTALGIAYEIDPRLVRGLDYYTSTTFEFSSQALDAAQNGIGGGGRYDRLVEQMGGQAHAGHRLRHRHRARAHRLRRRGRRSRATHRAADVFVVDGMDNADARSRCSSPSSARTACAPNAPTVTARSRRR